MSGFDRQLWQRFLAIAKPYWFSEEKRGARGLLAVLLLLSLSVSGLNVIISYVGRDFMTALSKKDAEQYFRLLFIYGSVFVVGTPIVVFYRYSRELLGLYWRNWLTNSFLDRYFRNRAYYEINLGDKIDNPDQRIAEDIKSFTIDSLFFLLIILNSVINLFAFTGILWSISALLAGILVIYAVVGTTITVLFGKRLIGLNFQQLKKEADFRYGLVHIRDNAESIAFYRGENQESGEVKGRFGEAIRNYNLLIEWQRNLGFFTQGYDYIIIILPALVIAPRYFAGEVEFGVISQASFAFSMVLNAISIIVDQIYKLSAFAAGVNRLSTFSESLEDPTESQKPGATVIDTVEDGRLSLEHVTLLTPRYDHTLVKDLMAGVKPGEGLVIVGQSGTGKSSLLRAIAGLWNNGTGRIVRPKLEDMLFLPQRPYMLLGSLRSQLLYPNTNQAVADEKLYEILKQVNLANLPERVGGFDVVLDWADILSLGEQQRLAFARLLLTQPRYAILDEATSALDIKNEERLYQQLQETGTTFVSVGHRSSLLKYHHQVLELEGEAKWRLYSVQDYNPGVSALA
jgi:vitamin B12/bleomycin/antimicrobial peptide transport system ATP-binding/permease protein